MAQLRSSVFVGVNDEVMEYDVASGALLGRFTLNYADARVGQFFQITHFTVSSSAEPADMRCKDYLLYVNLYQHLHCFVQPYTLSGQRFVDLVVSSTSEGRVYLAAATDTRLERQNCEIMKKKQCHSHMFPNILTPCLNDLHLVCSCSSQFSQIICKHTVRFWYGILKPGDTTALSSRQRQGG
jgi:hypothetical protein